MLFPDPLLQFAYHPNDSTEGAISSVLHLSLTHVREEKNTRVQMLFVDFSSASNTFIPLNTWQINWFPWASATPICNWLLDFHTKRPNFVQVNNNLSNVISLSTSSPQGCILHLMLFTLMTKTAVPGSLLIASKYADNTAVVGLDWGDNDWGRDWWMSYTTPHQ